MWFAYHTDFSGFAFFTNELDALRYAVANKMEVQKMKNGETRQDIGKKK
jgi:hypothetical protein